MRKIILTFIITCFFIACNDRLEEINKPTKGAVVAPAETLFANGVNEMFYMMNNSNTNVNVFRLYAQYWAQTTYPDESQYNMVTRRNPDNFWRGAYRDALKDLDEARKITEATWETLGITEAEKNNRLAIIEFCKVYVYATLVDAFGAVPYTESLNEEILQPKYESGQEVYNNIIVDLNEAIEMLDPSADSWPSGQDIVYEGDTEAWLKFANSLKLKLAITISDVDGGKAGSMVAEAVAGGIFESNDDNASVTYLDAFPNTHPVHEDLVQSGRDDYVIANTIVDPMNELYDPRLLVYAQGVDFVYPLNKTTKKERDSTVTTGGNMILYYPGSDSVVLKTTPFTIFAKDTLKPVQLFVGGVYGTNNTFALKSHVGEPFYQPDTEGLILDYAEVQFLLAEAAERGFATPETAEDHYNAGITASMEYWGIAAEDIEDYLANPDVAYTTAAGDWKQKIGLQHWLALYNRGFEGWTVWRRLDFTGFNAPPLLTYDEIPERFIFPIEEATLNKENLNEGIQLIGGTDSAQTPVFWDVN
jgi:hypothetical protein